MSLQLMGEAKYSPPASDSALGCITKIENITERLPYYLTDAETKLTETRRLLEVAKESVKNPFEYEEKLSGYLTRQSEINTMLEFKELSKQQDEFLSEGSSDKKSEENEIEDEHGVENSDENEEI